MGNWHEKIKDYSDQDKLTANSKKDWNNRNSKWFGVPVFPASRSCTGSQQIPYIYDDRACHEDIIKALTTLYNMPKGKRQELGLEAREWALDHFAMDSMVGRWDSLFEKTIEKFETVSVRRAVL